MKFNAAESWVKILWMLQKLFPAVALAEALAVTEPSSHKLATFLHHFSFMLGVPQLPCEY